MERSFCVGSRTSMRDLCIVFLGVCGNGDWCHQLGEGLGLDAEPRHKISDVHPRPSLHHGRFPS